jgi:hypothetical protein
MPASPDLSEFRYAMEPIPARVEAAIEAGVQRDKEFPFAGAARLLDVNNDAAGDVVVRHADATLFVACRTEMPGVTPAMWDWWFGWHGYASERYQLWHPEAHLKSSMREDRRGLTNDRARYVGNVSYVDEYIGPVLQRLGIAFQLPSSFGFNQAAVDEVGTVICARTSLRRERVNAGYLAHFVKATPDGSEMLSRFWLGHLESQLPGIGRALTAVVDRPAVRSRMLTDAMGLDLLRHCSEEMNHLARILPRLYERFGGDASA